MELKKRREVVLSAVQGVAEEEDWCTDRINGLIKKCGDNPRFRAAIACATRGAFDLFTTYMTYYHSNIVRNVSSACLSSQNNTMKIGFKNGSTIDVFIISDGMCGKKFNEILVGVCDGWSVSPETIRQILYPMITPYKRFYGDMPSCDEECAGEDQVDEFDAKEFNDKFDKFLELLQNTSNNGTP